MAVSLRLKRCGTKGRPFYRVVAVDSRKKRDGKVLEILGTYNPLTDPPAVKIEQDRYDYWIGCGAKPSATVNSLIAKTAETAVQTES